MAATSIVMELVDRFRRNLDAFKRDGFKETRVRVEFIDPLFEALGWDVRNLQGHAEQYKDVIHEVTLQSMKVEINFNRPFNKSTNGWNSKTLWRRLSALVLRTIRKLALSKR